MIVEYFRPETLVEALDLLSRKGIKTVPLGGGTALNQPSAEQVAAVDLQALGLNQVELHGQTLAVGAMTTLQAILEHPDTPEVLAKVIRYEASYNLRQAATIAGTLMSASGRSPFATLLLAWDALLEMHQAGKEPESVGLGDVLPVRVEALHNRLITKVILGQNVRVGYEYVARTPADLPLVCVSVARWPSGRTRLALGGYGAAPVLAMDGPQADGLEQAARDAYSQAGDEWASADYRREAAATLALRCFQALK